jgi:hypothetical protein
MRAALIHAAQDLRIGKAELPSLLDLKLPDQQQESGS